jgi:hypothetical protein
MIANINKNRKYSTRLNCIDGPVSPVSRNKERSLFLFSGVLLQQIDVQVPVSQLKQLLSNSPDSKCSRKPKSKQESDNVFHCSTVTDRCAKLDCTCGCDCVRGTSNKSASSTCVTSNKCTAIAMPLQGMT